MKNFNKLTNIADLINWRKSLSKDVECRLSTTSCKKQHHCCLFKALKCDMLIAKVNGVNDNNDNSTNEKVEKLIKPPRFSLKGDRVNTVYSPCLALQDDIRFLACDVI